MEPMRKAAAIGEAATIPIFGMTSLYLASKARRSPFETGMLAANAAGFFLSMIVSAIRAVQSPEETCESSQRGRAGRACGAAASSSSAGDDDEDDYTDDDEECPIMCPRQMRAWLRKQKIANQARAAREDELCNGPYLYPNNDWQRIPTCTRSERYKRTYNNWPSDR